MREEKRRRKLSRTGERTPGMLLLTNQFHDLFECLSVIWHKKNNFVPYKRPASIALLSRSSHTRKFNRKLDCSPYMFALAGELSSATMEPTKPKKFYNTPIPEKNRKLNGCEA